MQKTRAELVPLRSVLNFYASGRDYDTRMAVRKAIADSAAAIEAGTLREAEDALSRGWEALSYACVPHGVEASIYSPIHAYLIQRDNGFCWAEIVRGEPVALTGTVFDTVEEARDAFWKTEAPVSQEVQS